MRMEKDRSAVRSPSRRERWTARRNAILANPRFQRLAAAIPPLSLVARKRAGRLFDLCAGFAYSQALFASLESGLLELLAKGPCNGAGIAAATGLSEAAALRLVRAAAALELAEEIAPGRWMLGRQGAALHGNRGAQAMIRHNRLLYADLADPLDLLRRDRAEPTAVSRFWRYEADAEPAQAEADAYSQLMAASQEMVAREVIGTYRFARHRAVLDVGGGHGAFVTVLAAAWPKLRLTVFDLPAVLEGASERLAATGIGERVTLHPGDFFETPLPRGHDCISLIRILHDHDDEACLALLGAIRRALPPGGRLLIAEPLAGTPGAEAMGDAYFGLYLWAMGRGRPRSAREYGAMLERAGFARWRELRVRQPVVTGAVVGFC